MSRYPTRESYLRKWRNPVYFNNIVLQPGGLLAGNSGAFWGLASKATHISDIYALLIDSFIDWLDARVQDMASPIQNQIINAGWQAPAGPDTLPQRRHFLEQYLFQQSRVVNREIATLIRTGKTQIPKVLDIGCGISVLYDELHGDVQYHGIDVSERLLGCSFAHPHMLKRGEFPQIANLIGPGNKFEFIVDCLCSKDHYIYSKDGNGLRLEAPGYRQWLTTVNGLLVEGGSFIHVRPVQEYEARMAKNPALLRFEQYLGKEWSIVAGPELRENYALYQLKK